MRGNDVGRGRSRRPCRNVAHPAGAKSRSSDLSVGREAQVQRILGEPDQVWEELLELLEERLRTPVRSNVHHLLAGVPGHCIRHSSRDRLWRFAVGRHQPQGTTVEAHDRHPIVAGREVGVAHLGCAVARGRFGNLARMCLPPPPSPPIQTDTQPMCWLPRLARSGNANVPRRRPGPI